jgi:cyclohexanecarboxylate-CoA ligase
VARLRPTIRHARAGWYRRPGGPWDGPSLAEGLGPAPAGAAEVAGWLRGMGVRRGDVVAWQLANGPEVELLYRASWQLGAVAAPLHHRAGRADVDAALSRLDPSVVVAGAGAPAAERSGSVVVEGKPAWAGATPALAASPARPTDIAVVLFTAGSSGRPKAVMHTHRGLLGKARSMARLHGLGPADVVLMPAPLAHVSGLLNGILVPSAAGMRSVLMPAWDPEEALAIIQRQRITFMVGPPTFFVGLMAAPGFSRERVASLRLVSGGGAGVTPAFAEDAADRLGAVVKRTYGSTEAPSVTTWRPGDPPAMARESDGRAGDDVEVRIVDPETGRPFSPSQSGEVWLRGPEVFAGYLDEDATRAAHARGGWFRTGDLGRLADGGWLTITGRLTEVIIRGGENIAAGELEAVLEQHPAVRHAVVVGYPDERLGERVCAFVVSSSPFDLEASSAWLAQRAVTRYKWPERVVRVRDIPVLEAGKPDRAELRRRAAAP